MLQSTGDASQIYRSATNVETPQDLQQQNLALLNLGRTFAVVKNSEYNNSFRTETLKFQTPDWGMELIEAGYVEGDSVEDLGVLASDPDEGLEDIPYTNLFRYNVDYGSRASQNGNAFLGAEEAKDFFMSQKYRITFDEVPQNSDALGKFFPVVYGSVQRVPMLQVISHKVLLEDEATAGDDLYIYASHPCLSQRAGDFDIEIQRDDDSGGTKQFKRVQGLPSALNRHEAQSPFPKRLYNHHYRDEDGNLNTGQILYNPYHDVEIKESLDGRKYYGIRLAGAKWDSSVGSPDKRFPIRHGVGSSTLLASFAGKTDSRGRFIQHPLDIIVDFVKSFGRWPYTENMFDQENIDYVKSLTRKLRAAVYLDRQISISEFIDKLCRQTGLAWYPDSGKVKFAVLNVDEATMLDRSKPISEHLNLVQAVQAQDAGKQVAYSRVIYRFQKNYATGGYDKVIDLNPRNNLYCAAASKALGSKKEFRIEADWVNDPGVAFFAASRIASIVSRSRIEYQMEVIRGEKLYKPGDLVPVTYAPLGLNQTSMLIQSVRELDFADQIVAVRLV
jgi:hypothetical protein